MKLWEGLPKLFPPDNWRPPPPAGYVDAQGWRRHSLDPWRPVRPRASDRSWPGPALTVCAWL